VRMIVAAFDIAGTLIGFQMGLTNVFTVGIATSQQSAILGVFLGACATIILFVTDLHFLILGTLVDSYSLWKPAALPDLNLISEDLFNLVMNVLGKSFLLGLQLSGPIILVSLLISLAGGLLNRLIPQFQVFFVLQPLQIALGLMVLYLTLEVAMRFMYGTVEDIFTSFWTGGHA
jgi:flagellar biosynthetic protein FliR